MLSGEEKAKALQSGKKLILIGPNFTDWPEPAFEYYDGDGGIGFRLYGMTFPDDLPSLKQIETLLPDDPLSIVEPSPYRAELVYRAVSGAFFDQCARVIQRVTGTGSIEAHALTSSTEVPQLKIGIMMTENRDQILRLAVKNSAPIYGRPIINLGHMIRNIKVCSTFPVSRIKADGDRFRLVVSPMGIVILDIVIDQDC